MIYSGNSFFDRAEVKDMMAYFKLVVNNRDDESFRRVVNKPARGIGDKALQAVEAVARQQGWPLFLAAREVPKVQPFCEMVARLSGLVATTDAHELALKIAEQSGLYAFYKLDTSIEGLARMANLDELLNSVKQFVEEREEEAEDYLEDNAGEHPVYTLDDYLENVSLLSNVDVTEDEDTNNKVALMTVHSSKGLEFPYVFVAGLEENLFPNVSMLSARNEIEEERRLFYVAVTRAKTAVALAFAGTRMRNGRHESIAPSRFLKEIDPRFLDHPLVEADFDNSGVTHEWGGFGSARGALGDFHPLHPLKGDGRISAGADRRPRTTTSGWQRSGQSSAPVPGGISRQLADMDFVGVPMTELSVGQRIEHNRFGPGTILDLSGSAPEMKARIRFDAHGEKLLLLKYAKIRPLKN